MNHEHVFEKLQTLNAWHGEEGEYCEPGYSSDKPVLFGDWNPVPLDLLAALEEHFTLDWEDEWISCERCGHYFRVTGSSYFWTMYGIIGGEITCGDCIKEDPEPFVADLINNPEACARPFIDLPALGFVNMNDTSDTFESGRHPHQTDNPVDILAKYQQRYPSYEFVFGNLQASQFYVTFEIWGRPAAGVPA